MSMHDVAKEHWDYVQEVEPKEGSRLAIVFRDGKRGEYDMSGKLDYPCYHPLKDPAYFKKAHVAFGTVCWPGDIDIAPEELYFNSTTCDA